jgi:SAM-dependent methyltransferase
LNVTVQQRAEAVPDDIFLGGPRKDFESVGRLQLVTMLQEGLNPYSKVLDVGCGCLRGGYWLIHFLDPGCYFGIEPDRAMLDAGLTYIVEPEVAEAKRPAFADNDNFDFSVFGVDFDFVVARSVWTHAAKVHIRKMLDSFAATAAPGAIFLTSYLPAVPIGPASGRMGRLGTVARDYRGDGWIGHSHESSRGGLVAHSKRWIFTECRARGLSISQLRHGVVNRQKWLRISVDRGSRP